MNILITGAGGFIGRSLIEEITKNDSHFVYAAVRSITSNLPKKNNCEYIKFDIEDRFDLSPIFEKVECIIHLAAKQHNIFKIFDNYRFYSEVNVDSLEHILKYCLKSKIKKFIFLSSAQVLGNQTEDNPFNNTSGPNPKSYYAKSKFEAEKLVHKYLNNKVNYFIIRAPLVYGANVKGNLRVLYYLIKYNIPLPLKNLNNKRSIISLDNLNDFIIHMITFKNNDSKTFLVSDGNDLSTSDLINAYKKNLNSKTLVLDLPSFIMSFMNLISKYISIFGKIFLNFQVNIDKTIFITGWKPRHDQVLGFKNMIDSLEKRND